MFQVEERQNQYFVRHMSTTQSDQLNHSNRVTS